MRARLTSMAAVIAAAFLGLVALGPALSVAQAASPARSAVNVYQGTLTAVPTSLSAPATLTVQTPHRGLVNVLVTANTRMVRRYYGASGLDEGSVNDVLPGSEERRVGQAWRS